jgi:hypothetical protein
MGKTPRPRHHRIAAPVQSRFVSPGARFGEDPLYAGDDERDDPAAVRRVDPEDHIVAA